MNYKVMVVLGILCIAYFMVIKIYAGSDKGFSYVWLVAGFLCLVFSYVPYYMAKGQITVPPTVNRILIGGFVVGLLAFLLLEGVIIYHASRKPGSGADYMIVLGAKVNKTVVSRTLKKRLDAAINYANWNRDAHVIVSGGMGPGEDVTEAFAMKEYMVGKGIREERIRLEERSTNTNENIAFSKEIIAKEKGDKQAEEQRIVIVSNGFHIYRATSIAKKNGFRNVEGLGAASDPVLRLNYYVREAFAVVKDVWKGNMS